MRREILKALGLEFELLMTSPNRAQERHSTNCRTGTTILIACNLRRAIF